MDTASLPAAISVIRRLGVAAFLFFLIKGMLWLAAPLVFIWLV